MNRKIYVSMSKQGFSKKVSEGVSICIVEAGKYAACASSQGLGIEHKKCQSEFSALKSCLKRGK